MSIFKSDSRFNEGAYILVCNRIEFAGQHRRGEFWGTPAIINKIGWFASAMAIAMYVSYIDQIMLNISGQAGSVILPIVTTINGTAWVLYGSLKPKKDWPIIACNIPGIILGFITAITSVIC